MLPLALTALMVALTVLVVRRHWWLTRVRSWSMYPTLRSGDHVWTRRLPGAANVERGDIVVIDSTELGRRIVKRVVGMPGETIRITRFGVSIDGRPLPEPYVTAHGGPTGSFRVPTGSYLVLGDNRPASDDARTWVSPFTRRSAVRGRVTPLAERRRPLDYDVRGRRRLDRGAVSPVPEEVP